MPRFGWLVCLLFVYFSIVASQNQCQDVICEPLDCNDPYACSDTVWDEDGCCQQCCEEPCVDCFQDPCNSYTCGDNPAWICQANYCGGCNREWYDSDGEYHICSNEIFDVNPCDYLDCDMQPICDNNNGFCNGYSYPGDGCCPVCCEEQCSECFADPCYSYVCNDNLNWHCEPNYCGGCNREWFDDNGGHRICENEEFVEENICNLIDCYHGVECSGCGLIWDENGCCQYCCPEESCTECFVNPCDFYVCEDNASWTCQANYCGGCNREWYDENGSYQICKSENIVPSQPQSYETNPFSTVIQTTDLSTESTYESFSYSSGSSAEDTTGESGSLSTDSGSLVFYDDTNETNNASALKWFSFLAFVLYFLF